MVYHFSVLTIVVPFEKGLVLNWSRENVRKLLFFNLAFTVFSFQIVLKMCKL